MPSVSLRVPISDIPQSKREEFSKSATDVVLESSNLPERDAAILKALAVLGVDCPVQTMDSLKDGVELRIGRRP
jgi:hypothetical protein